MLAEEVHSVQNDASPIIKLVRSLSLDTTLHSGTFLLLTVISNGLPQYVIESLTKLIRGAYKHHRPCHIVLNQHPSWVSDE